MQTIWFVEHSGRKQTAKRPLLKDGWERSKTTWRTKEDMADTTYDLPYNFKSAFVHWNLLILISYHLTSQPCCMTLTHSPSLAYTVAYCQILSLAGTWHVDLVTSTSYIRTLEFLISGTLQIQRHYDHPFTSYDAFSAQCLRGPATVTLTLK